VVQSCLLQRKPTAIHSEIRYQGVRYFWHCCLRVGILLKPGRIFPVPSATVYVEGQLKIKKWKDSVGLDHSLTEIQLRNQGQIQVIKRGNPPSESRQREYDQIPLGDHEEDSPREDEDDER
jgi:hypothetical protein